VLRPARVINRADHPITLAYNGDALHLAPRADVFVNDQEKLGALPRLITVVPAPERLNRAKPR
jgi:hypothetical protein